MTPRKAARRHQASVGIIGAGIFGITAALELDRLDVSVTLYEKRPDILSGTTARNFFRVHRGYHYPRDPHTARQARDGYASFARTFKDALAPTTPHHYAIAATGSRTTAEQFQQHCDQLGIRARPVQLPTIKPDTVSATFEVDESYYDAVLLKHLSWERLHRSDVQIELNFKDSAHAVGQAHDFVVVTAYDSLNHVLAELDCPTMNLQYELCEVPVIHAPDLRSSSLVVVDGPFNSIAPYGGSDLHLLYDVVHSVHTRTAGHRRLRSHSDTYLSAYSRQLPPASTRFTQILSSTRRFVSPLTDVTHVGSLFAERVVLPDVSDTDARPTVVRWVTPSVMSVLSGKVCTSVDAGAAVAEAIASKLGLPNLSRHD